MSIDKESARAAERNMVRQALREVVPVRRFPEQPNRSVAEQLREVQDLLGRKMEAEQIFRAELARMRVDIEVLTQVVRELGHAVYRELPRKPVARHGRLLTKAKGAGAA